MADGDRSGTSANGEDRPPEPHSPVIHHKHDDEEEAEHPASTSKEAGGQQRWCPGLSEVPPKNREDFVLDVSHLFYFYTVISFIHGACKAAKSTHQF